jgi:D-inositol-3-phosphate glycosyltransferase
MKIVSLGPAFPYRGGIASFTDRLALQFASEGHDIQIVTFSLQYPKLLFPGKTQFTDGKGYAGIKIRRLLNSVNPLSWIHTGRLIRKENPDILLIRYWLPFMAPSLGTVARIVRRNKKTVAICIFDNVIPHEKRPGDNFLTKYFTKSIDGAIVMSQSVQDDLKKFRNDIPCRFSPHPLFDNYGEVKSREDALGELQLDPGFSYILFFGFIRAYKGLDLLIEAFADKRLRNRKIRLIVAGEFYEDKAPYTSLIKKYDLTEDVILFDHFIKDSEVSLFFGGADLVVQPYKSATQSGVTQIAFHYDKPMVVTDVGGLREIVPDGKCGYVVPPLPEAIADSIDDFFSNLRNQIFTDFVKEEKKRFSWDRMTASIIQVYRKIKN